MRRGRSLPKDLVVLTAFGVASAVVMVVAYALESRGPTWIAIFAVGCASTALYGILTQSWIFAGLEIVWSALAVRRFIVVRESSQASSSARSCKEAIRSKSAPT